MSNTFTRIPTSFGRLLTRGLALLVVLSCKAVLVAQITVPGSHPSLASAFAAINAGAFTDAVTIDITASYAEPAGSAVLNSSGAGAASYTSVSIRPSVDGVVITGTSVGGRGVIELNGADNVTINGDNPNTGGVNRDLTITNTLTSTTGYGSVIRIALSTLINSANDITIQNCSIIGHATARNVTGLTSTTNSENTSYGIICSGGASTVAATTAPSALSSLTTAMAAGQTANNFSVVNCQVNACSKGIAVNSSVAANINQLTISNNIIGDASSASTTTVYTQAITAQGFTAATISGNLIQNIQGFVGSSTGVNTLIGIGLGNLATTSTGTNALVENNTINRVFTRNTGTWPATGVYLNLSAASNTAVRNNFITGVQRDITGSTGFSAALNVGGIKVIGGNTYSIDHNSVNMFGTWAGSGNNTSDACLVIATTAQTNVNVRNNIFRNTVLGGGTGTAHCCVILPTGGTSAMNYVQNNNAYYCASGTNQFMAHNGFTFSAPNAFSAANFVPGSTAGATNWRTYTSTLSASTNNDNASFGATTTVPYISDTDLHIDISSPSTAPLNGTGAAGTGIALDIDGDTRGVPPDMGADEFVPAGCFPPTGTVAIVPSCGGPLQFFLDVTVTNLNGATGVDVVSDYGTNPGAQFGVGTVTVQLGPFADMSNVQVSLLRNGDANCDVVLGTYTYDCAEFGKNALSFDGVNDRVSIPDNASTNITGNAVTLEAWIYPTTWRGGSFEGSIINKEPTGNGGYVLRCGANGSLSFNVGNSAGWLEIISSTNALTLNTWQHVAGVFDGTSMKFYRDGVQLTPATSLGSFLPIGTSAGIPLQIGEWSQSDARGFIGKIDEARVWNVALGQSTIVSGMNQLYCGDETGLVAYYRFDQGVSGGDNTGVTTLTDLTANANDGTLTGFALNGSTSNWVQGKTGLAACVPVTCFAPAGLNMTLVTGSSAQINWTDNGSASYDWEIRTSGLPGSGPSGRIDFGNVSGTPANSALLTQLTSYTAYVRSSCTSPAATSVWVQVGFATPCGTAALPIQEGFNSTTIPNCWAQQFVVGTDNVTYATTGTSPTATPFEGTHMVYYNSFNFTADHETRLRSLPVNTVGVDNVRVEFEWFESYSSTYTGAQYLTEGVTVQYSLDGTTWTDAPGGYFQRENQSFTSGTGGWFHKTLVLPASVGQQPIAYVGFLFHSEFGYRMYMDLVKINSSDVPPPCATYTAPANGASVEAAIGTNLTWNAVGGAAGYKLYLGTDGGGVTLPTSVANGTDLGNVLTTPTGVLTANTLYYWAILPYNGFGDATGCTIANFNTNPPSCSASPTSPTNGGTQCAGAGVTLTWAASAGATSYDVLLAVSPGPPVLVANVGTNTYNAGALGGNYVWSIVPRNSNGPATGCATWNFSVTAAPVGDTFGNAIVIPDLVTTYTSTGNDNLAANCYTNNQAFVPGRDKIWSILTSSCTTQLTIGLCATGGDSHLIVMAADQVTVVGENDDCEPTGAGCGTLNSSIGLNMTCTGGVEDASPLTVMPNTLYYIIMAGHFVGSDLTGMTLTVSANCWCTQPAATVAAINSACPTFTIPVNVTNTGSTGTANIQYTVNGGAPVFVNSVSTGVTTIPASGSFNQGELIDIMVNTSDNSCGVSLGEYTDNCPIDIICGNTVTVNHCYKNFDPKTWTFAGNLPGETLTLTFTGGTMDPSDVIRGYSIDDGVWTPIPSLTSTFANLFGVSGQSLGDTLYLEIDSDGSNSCADAMQNPWSFEVECTPGCVDPDGIVTVNAACSLIDVEVTYVGDALTTTLSYSVNGGTPVLIPGLVDGSAPPFIPSTVTIGPFNAGESVQLFLLHETDGSCDKNLGVFVIPAQPQPVTLALGAYRPTVCAGGNSQLSAVASGGSGIITTYGYSTRTDGILDPMVGATQLVATGLTTTASAVTNIGFPFFYEGTSLTQFSANSNGAMRLGPTVVPTTGVNTGTFTTRGLYPLWDAHGTTAGGIVNTVLIGTAPSRIRIVNFSLNISGSGNLGQFQVWLYETSNFIEYRYGNSTASTASATVAAVGLTVANYGSVQDLGTHAVSTVTRVNTLAGWPGNGRVYRFVPPAVAGATYVWAPNTNIVGQENTANPMATAVTSSTTYTVTATANGCSYVNTITLDVAVPISGATATPLDPVICTNTNATLTAIPNDGFGPFTYLWSPGGAVTPSIVVNTAGGYSCQVTDFCGNAVSTNTTTVTVNPVPTAVPTAGAACSGTNLQLTGGTDFGTTFAWSGPAGFVNGTQNPSIPGITSANSGTYTFMATGGGCTGTGTVAVSVVNTPVITSLTGTPNPVCIGNNSQLNVTAPISGYTMGSGGSSFIDISGTGTPVTAAGDDSEHNVTIPGGFIFSGTSYTDLRIGSNGLAVFGSTTGDVTLTNAALFSTANTAGNVFVAPFWDDLDDGPATVNGNIYTQLVGNLFIVQWEGYHHWSAVDGQDITFQVQLNTSTGAIYFAYQDVIFGGSQAALDAGASATVGIQWAASAGNFIQYSFNTASLSDGQVVSFTPNQADILWTPNTYLTADNITNPIAQNVLADVTYTVTASQNGCTSPGSQLLLEANPAIGPNEAEITPDPASFCTGSYVILTALPLGGGGPYTFTWTPPGGPALPPSASPDIVASTVGTWAVEINDGCGSTANVSTTVSEFPVPVATAGGASPVCAGTSIMLDGSSSEPGSTFDWTGPASFSSTDEDPVISNATTAMTGTYELIATANGCSSDPASVVITVGAELTGISASSNPVVMCEPGGLADLFSTGGGGSPNILSANFNGSAPGWTSTNTTTTTGIGDVATAAWTIRPNNFVPNSVIGIWSETLSSNDASDFYLTNSDAPGNGSATHTTLVSPSFSLVGYQSATLEFFHYFRNLSAGDDIGVVEVSTDGSTWNPIQSYDANTGTPAGFAMASLDLVTYLGEASVQVRFRFDATWDWGWAVDNVSITGVPVPATFTWSSSPPGFSSMIQNPTGVLVNETTTYTVLVESQGCSAQADATVYIGNNDLNLVFQTDGTSNLTWELRFQGTGLLAQSGGGVFPASPGYNVTTCLPDGCFYLRVLDDVGDGITGGGYILFDPDGDRIIDNRNNFLNGSVSAIANNEGFCLPIGNDHMIYTSCDKLDWNVGPCDGSSPSTYKSEFIVADINASVSGDYPNAQSGFTFWFYNPNGGYNFRRFRSHAQGEGAPVAAADRYTHCLLNNWAAANALQQNTLYNVRVRAVVNNVPGEFGPACRMMLDQTAAQCPVTKLMDVPGNAFLSCGQSFYWGSGNYVYARPVWRYNNNCVKVNANRYRFHFFITGEPYDVTVTSGTYARQLNWGAGAGDPLVPGPNYEVTVEASFDNGATYCPAGDVCLVEITAPPVQGGNQNLVLDNSTGLRMYPNPNRGDQLYLALAAVKEGIHTVSVDIYDLFGKRVSARTLAVQDGFINTVLDLHEMAAGMYMVNITAGETVYTERLVIQR